MFKLLDVPVFLLTAAMFAYCFAKTLKTYRQKRKKTAFYLLVLFAACVVINICSAIDGLLYQVVYNTRYGYAISLIFTAIALIGLLYFATEIFSSGATQKLIQCVRFVFSASILVVSIWGTASLMPGQPIGTSLPLIFIFMLSLALYIVLAVQAYGLAKRVEDDVYKKSISYIGHFAICNLGIYTSFILDSLIPGQEGTTIWSFIGIWVFALMAYLAYIGFVKPMDLK